MQYARHAVTTEPHYTKNSRQQSGDPCMRFIFHDATLIQFVLLAMYREKEIFDKRMRDPHYLLWRVIGYDVFFSQHGDFGGHREQ